MKHPPEKDFIDLIDLTPVKSINPTRPTAEFSRRLYRHYTHTRRVCNVYKLFLGLIGGTDGIQTTAREVFTTGRTRTPPQAIHGADGQRDVRRAVNEQENRP